MKKVTKIILGVLLAVLIVGQFIRPKQNVSSEKSADDISSVVEVSPEVEQILVKACYDCHSNNTNYPWYNNIFPVSWYLYNHVYGGKKHLDFSLFKTYEQGKQIHKLEEVIEEVKEGNMPLGSYVRIHPEAELTKQEKEALVAWVDQSIKKLK
jgi:hypothetical protein